MTPAPPLPVGRLAPTPSGHLHLGNALAFGACWLSARGAGGRVLLRIEDLDRGRARSEIADSQRRDLEWLGLHGTRRCRHEHADLRGRRLADLPVRLHPAAAPSAPAPTATTPRRRGAPAVGAAPLDFVDVARPQRVAPDQDAVLIRKDGEPGYPLAVVVDDHRDGVTEVVRGADLLGPTAVQVELYRLLGWPEPTWLHAPLLLGADGRKLGKSHGSTELRRSARGWGAARVWRLLLPLLGVEGDVLSAAPLSPRGGARRTSSGRTATTS